MKLCGQRERRKRREILLQVKWAEGGKRKQKRREAKERKGNCFRLSGPRAERNIKKGMKLCGQEEEKNKKRK